MVQYPLIPLDPAQQDSQITTIVVATTATIASGSILTTLLVFPILMKKKIYLQMVFFATLCDFFATSSNIAGFPTTKFTCTMQAGVTQFFLLASWGWTYFIAQKLYCTLTFEGGTTEDEIIPWYSLRIPAKGYSMKQMHFIIWSIDLFFFFIPYSTGTVYGRVDWQIGTDLCFYKESNDFQKYYSHVWTIVCFYSPLVVLILGTSYHTVRLWRRFKYLSKMHHTAVSERKAHLTAKRAERQIGTTNVQRAVTVDFSAHIISRADEQSGNTIIDLVKSTIWYPIFLIICWTPNVLQYIVYIYVRNSKYDSWYEYRSLNKTLDVIGGVSFSLGMSYGVGACAIFFGVKKEARVMWTNLLYNGCIKVGILSESEPDIQRVKKKKNDDKTPDINDPIQIFKEAYDKNSILRVSDSDFTQIEEDTREASTARDTCSSTIDDDDHVNSDEDEDQHFPEYYYEDDEVYERASMATNKRSMSTVSLGKLSMDESTVSNLHASNLELATMSDQENKRAQDIINALRYDE